MNPTLSIYLDAVRLAAALLVMFGHAFNFTGGYFHLVAGHGPASVAIFFVLSGFVIAFVTDKKEKSGKEYAVSRAARMYSVALPALIVTVVADYVGQQFDPLPYQGYVVGVLKHVNSSYFYANWTWLDLTRMLSFTNELWQDHVQVGSGEPYWSLGFEVWYYIIFGLYLFAPMGQWARLLLAGLAALIAGPKIVLYLPLWLLGVACYQYLKKSASNTDEPRALAVYASGLAFLATPVAYLLVRRFIAPQTQAMFLPVGLNTDTVITVGYFHLIGLLFGINLLSFNVLAKRYRLIGSVAQRCKRPIQWLAGATFTLYLVHQPLLLTMLAINPVPQGGALWAYSSLAATVVIIFALAQVTERQKTTWKRLFQILLHAPAQGRERTHPAN